ncbi:MAG: ribosome recycling factor, partial [Desulfobacterales bacterium]
VRVVHNRMEETRVRIRNTRRDLIRDLREFEKEGLISEDDQERGRRKMVASTGEIPRRCAVE